MILYGQLIFVLVCFVPLPPRLKLWPCRGCQFTLQHIFPGQAVNQYFVHILSLVTENNCLEHISGKVEKDCRNYNMINLHEVWKQAGTWSVDMLL